MDDGSTDGTKAILAEYQQREPRIRALERNRLPKGACTCRNIGLETARGDYVIFLDSDDLLAPTCLERRVATIREQPTVDFSVHQGFLFNNVPGDLQSAWNNSSDETDLCRFLRGDSVWQTTGPIWKRAALQRLKGFDEALACWQDVDIHLSALARGLTYQKKMESEPDYYIRRHSSGSISQKGFKSRQTVGSVFRVFDKTSEILKTSSDPDIKHALRQMLAHGVQLAFDNRYLDLARQGIRAGKKQHLLTPHQGVIWRLALAGYAMHAKGFRGFARLGKRLLEPYQPRLAKHH